MLAREQGRSALLMHHCLPPPLAQLLSARSAAERRALLADAVAWLQVQLLCDAGADTGALVDGWGCTALFLAAHNGFGDVAQVLVDAGANELERGEQRRDDDRCPRRRRCPSTCCCGR